MTLRTTRSVRIVQVAVLTTLMSGITAQALPPGVVPRALVSTPTNLHFTSSGWCFANLAWTDNGGSETNYELWARRDGGAWEITLLPANSESAYFNPPGGAPGHFDFKVRQRRLILGQPAIYSGFSNTVSRFIDCGPN